MLGTGAAMGAEWPGLGGLVGGWTSLTRSSPNESYLLSDSRNCSVTLYLVVPVLFLSQGI